jgi:undecaprenyl-diphosphatase
MEWEKITNITLLTSFAVLAVFVFLGLYQWITRNSLKKVDKRILAMPIPLILMAITYFVFDNIWILNTRPDGSGEPSFPSTHVMVVATIMFIATLNLNKYVKQKTLNVILEILMVVLVSLTCVGRVLANKHWISDVLGALAFAFIFSEVYYLIIKKRSKKHEQHLHEDH